MEKRKRIYISGKIGEDVISDETREKFQQAENMLKKKRYDVVNPAGESVQAALADCIELHKQASKQEVDEYAVVLCTEMSFITGCDAIYMLKDWTKSPGATAEHYFAKAIGREIIYEEE